jgi:hypothetical protein
MHMPPPPSTALEREIPSRIPLTFEASRSGHPRSKVRCRCRGFPFGAGHVDADTAGRQSQLEFAPHGDPHTHWPVYMWMMIMRRTGS